VLDEVALAAKEAFQKKGLHAFSSPEENEDNESAEESGGATRTTETSRSSSGGMRGSRHQTRSKADDPVDSFQSTIRELQHHFAPENNAVRQPYTFHEADNRAFVGNHPVFDPKGVKRSGKAAKTFDLGPLWTEHEEKALQDGYTQFGKDLQKILHRSAVFNPERTVAHLDSKLRFEYQKEYRQNYPVWVRAIREMRPNLSTEQMISCVNTTDEQENLLLRQLDRLNHKEAPSWTDDEIQIIVLGMKKYDQWLRGGRTQKRNSAWQKIAAMLPGRTTFEVRTFSQNHMHEHSSLYRDFDDDDLRELRKKIPKPLAEMDSNSEETEEQDALGHDGMDHA